MTSPDIIRKYYNKDTELYNLLYTHSRQVADKALEIAGMHPEMNLDKVFVEEAAMLHDIGIFCTNAPKIDCYGVYDYICHGYLGAELLRKEDMPAHALVCERHTGSGITKQDIIDNHLPLPARDMLPISSEEKLICFADKFYTKTHPDKIKTIDEIRKSMAKYGEDSVERFDKLVKLFLG